MNDTQTSVNLIGQFILCKSESSVPEHWITRQHGSWLLAYHPALPAIEILGSDSSALGWLLGYPISPNGHLVTGSVRLPISPIDDDAPFQFESSIYAFGGRFAAVFFTAHASRFYLDAGGTLATVFCPGQQIVASSPNLIPYAEGCGDNEELIRALGIPEKDKGTYFPFGLTPRHSVERLLPNHFLDLATWESVRHWPTDETVTAQDFQCSVSEIAAILRNHITAIARDHPIQMSLTAGRDTRVLLACAREHLDRIGFFTISIADSQAMLDCKVARRIAKRYGLDHVVLRFEEATETELNEWLYRTGNCVAGRTWAAVRAFRQLDPQCAYLTGQGGEVGRLYYWRDGDNESSPVSVDDLLKRVRIPATAEIKNRGQKWLAGLPCHNTSTILDLFCIEEYLGSWNAPQQYGHVGSAFRLLPFSHRRIFEIIMGLPLDYRLRSMLAVDVIRDEWPELLHFPFNEPIGIERYVSKVKRAAESIPREVVALAKRRFTYR